MPYSRFAQASLAVFLAAGLLACGGKELEVQPKVFATDWEMTESEHFRFYLPPDSPRSLRAQAAFAEACEEIHALVTRYLGIEVEEPIAVYLFTTNQDCEKATGHSSGFVEEYNIYTSIGAEIGGVIALAMCHGIDPEAGSFVLIKEGLRTVFNERSANVHAEAQARITDEGRWYTLPEMIGGKGSADPETYKFARASFVAFLIQQYGSERFRMLWRSVLELGPSLERIYDRSLDQLDAQWMGHLAQEAKRT
jgi:hypothetical protein